VADGGDDDDYDDVDDHDHDPVNHFTSQQLNLLVGINKNKFGLLPCHEY
jgi:hypothetical protein